MAWRRKIQCNVMWAEAIFNMLIYGKRDLVYGKCTLHVKFAIYIYDCTCSHNRAIVNFRMCT